MLLDEMDAIIVVPINPVYQSIRTTNDLIHLVISIFNYAGFSTPYYLP
jgi:hypothetical protein